MTLETNGIEIKNKGILIFGIILLLIGLGASFYYESKSILGFEYMRTYPYQSIGMVLVLLGGVFVALGFFYSPRKEEVPKQSS